MTDNNNLNPANNPQPDTPTGPQEPWHYPPMPTGATQPYSNSYQPQMPYQNYSTPPVAQQQGAAFYNPDTQPAAKKNRALPGMVAVALVAALVGGGVGGGIVAANNDTPGANVTVSSDGDGTITTTADRADSELASVVANGLKSVVTVSAVSGRQSGTGSGVILNNDGYIVTNAHVATLEGGTANPDLTVQSVTGETYPATLVGYDATADLAVLKVDDKMDGTTPLKFASSDNLKVGTGTIAIGSPLGLSGTVTTGIVSALNRPITVSSSEVQNPNSMTQQQQASVALSVIQTDAAINPGNSGGALLDDNGNLIGLNVAIASAGATDSGNVGVGFAIPSDYVKRITAELIATGEGSHGFLGVSLQDYSENNSAFTSGAALSNITSGGAADNAGLQAGDVITSVDGDATASAAQLAAIVKQDAPGTEVEVTYIRDGAEKTAKVTLSDQ